MWSVELRSLSGWKKSKPSVVSATCDPHVASALFTGVFRWRVCTKSQVMPSLFQRRFVVGRGRYSDSLEYDVSPHSRTGNRAVTQMQYPYTCSWDDHIAHDSCLVVQCRCALRSGRCVRLSSRSPCTCRYPLFASPPV